MLQKQWHKQKSLRRELKQAKEPNVFGMTDSAPIMDMVVNAAGNLFVSKLIDQCVTPRYFIQFVTEAKDDKADKANFI